MNARAISAQLVDIRNVGTHKSVKLTIHVPEEQATLLVNLFGWPTMVDPVPVALARLNEQPKGGDAPDQPAKSSVVASPVQPQDKVGRATVAPEKRLAQRAGILGNDPMFWRFLEADGGCVFGAIEKEDAAQAIRIECGVVSRGEIKPGTAAAIRFDKLYSRFIAWRDVPAEVA